MIGGIISKLLQYRDNARQVMGINKRNLDYIYPNNPRGHFPLADNKLMTKEILKDSDVPVSRTLLTYGSFYELGSLRSELQKYSEFVIKPARGSGGGGIIVIVEKTEDGWLSAGGKLYTFAHIRNHITDIIFGIYSFGLNDIAVIEERLIQHPEFSELSPYGLADVRIILHKHEPVLCMSRVPTKASDGKANIHQGAIGLGIDIETGVTTQAILEDEFITHHPDTNVKLIDRQVPFWEKVIDMSQNAANRVPLKYLGIDIAIAEDGPVLIEINVRPGLQIQNANMTGMRSILERGTF